MLLRQELNINKWNSQLRKGVLEFCILSILERGRNYGYQIIQSLSDFTGVDIKRGTIYALFKRLYEEGYIRYQWEESNYGPPRKIYYLSQEGKQVLTKMKNHWNEFSNSVSKVIKGG